MKPKDRSIQQRLRKLILWTSVVVLVLTSASYFTYELITFRTSTRNQLSLLGEIISANSTAALAFENRKDADEILNALKAEKHILAACIYDGSGKIFSKYPSQLPDSEFPSTLEPDGFRFTKSRLEGFQPIVQEKNRLGTLYLKSDLKTVYAKLRLYGIVAIMVIAVSLIFAYLLSGQIQKLIVKPLLGLAETAKIISDHRDYAVRAEQSNVNEVRILTDAFNHMLEQIETQNQEIISFNQNLEQRIDQRTVELARTNETLRMQNDLVRTVIDSSVDFIAVLDKDLRYLVLNKHAEDAYHAEKGAFIGKRIIDIFPQLKDSGMYGDLQKALKGELIYNPEYSSPVLGKKFENFYIPLKNNDNKVDRVLMVGHDITNIMEANQKLQVMNAQLEKSNESLEQFAYVASHDLQEPLRKIQVFSDLGEKYLHNTEIAKRYLAKINSSANRLSELIKAILNYSRLSSLDAEWEYTDLNEILGHIKNDLELLIEEKKAVITSDYLPTIKGIPLQLNQLFFNLISNSLKFTNTHPVIRIHCRLMSEGNQELLALHLNGSYLKLSFEDNGIGFQQDLADKVFEIFQRVHDQQQYSGTGIGLALCKRIVDNHHGIIKALSKPGAGTTFKIYIPASLII
jgi:signal transduction histidine kinase/uncharacterized membrane protein affecting hemolysin expression